MRYVWVAAVGVALVLIGVPAAIGQGAGLSITNYQIVAQERYSSIQSFVTCRADLINAGPSLTGVAATVASLIPSVQIVPAGRIVGGSTQELSAVPDPLASGFLCHSTVTLFARFRG